MPIKIKPFKRHLKLQTLLMLVMLFMLILPISSQYFFSVYDNNQIQKTEIELIAQSVVFAATYRALYQKMSLQKPIDQTKNNPQDEYYHPVKAQLDLAVQNILPRLKNALKTPQNADPIALKVGQQMQSILIESQRFTLAGIKILDRQGIVIAGRSDKGLSLAQVKEVQQALKGRYSPVIRQRVSDEPPPALASISRNSKIRVFTAFPIIEQNKVLGVVYLNRSPQNVAKYLYSVRYKVFWLALFVLGFALVLIYFIANFLSRPITELTAQVRKITSGEAKTIQLSKQPNTYEFAELTNSFIKMSETLEARSTYIRDFAAHVSHEFKTPLTSIQGALELLEDHAEQMTAAQKKIFFNNLFADTKRLELLVTGLLELARADVKPIHSEYTQLKPVLDLYQSTYKARQLRIKFDPQAAHFKVKISQDSLQSVLINLFENSLQHSASQVMIDFKQQSHHLLIEIADNGSGISIANREKIFIPFFTTKRTTGGTGLGLGIVQSLLHNVQGQIKLMPSSTGTIFQMKLLI